MDAKKGERVEGTENVRQRNNQAVVGREKEDSRPAREEVSKGEEHEKGAKS